MNMQLICTPKIYGPLSYEVGPSCLINLGQVGKGRVLCWASWHGPSWFWAVVVRNSKGHGAQEKGMAQRHAKRA